MAANIFYKIIQEAGIVKSKFFVPVPAPAILKKIKRIFLFSIRPKPDFSAFLFIFQRNGGGLRGNFGRFFGGFYFVLVTSPFL